MCPSCETFLHCVNVLQMMLSRKVSDPGTTTEGLGVGYPPFILFLSWTSCCVPRHWIKCVHNRMKPSAIKGSEGLYLVASLLMVRRVLLTLSLPSDLWTHSVFESETLYVSFIQKQDNYKWKYSLTHIIFALNVINKKMLQKIPRALNTALYVVWLVANFVIV